LPLGIAAPEITEDSIECNDALKTGILERTAGSSGVLTATASVQRIAAAAFAPIRHGYTCKCEL